MTRKLMLGIFFVSLLLVTDIAFGAEGSSPVPAVGSMDAVGPDCGCSDEDQVPPLAALEADGSDEEPSLTGKFCPPRCKRVCGWVEQSDGTEVWRCTCLCPHIQ